MIPQAVVFDLGKVLLDFDYAIAAKKIQARSRISVRNILRLIDQSPLLFHYEAGSLTTEEFFAKVQSVSGISTGLEEFRGLFGDIFSPIEPMIELHAELRRHGVWTYVFSNTNELAVWSIRQRFAFFRDFDGYILSYEHHAMKPDAKLYEVVERLSGRKESELLYIDDRPENIAAAAARRWQTILHESPEKTWAAVRQSGLLEATPVPPPRL